MSDAGSDWGISVDEVFHVLDTYADALELLSRWLEFYAKKKKRHEVNRLAGETMVLLGVEMKPSNHFCRGSCGPQHELILPFRLGNKDL